MNTTNFEDVKVGDQVILHYLGWYHENKIGNVTKVTSKLFFVGSLRFYKKNGSGYGISSWCTIPTSKEIDEIKHKEMQEFVANTCKIFSVVKKLTSEELETIYKILKRYKNE